MTSPNFLPPEIPEETSERLTTRKLIKELSQLALNNRRFKAGDIDKIEFGIKETEYFLPIEVDAKSAPKEPEAEDDNWVPESPIDDGDGTTIEYSFMAERVLDKGRANLGFVFSTSVLLTNVDLPELVAEQNFGVSAEEAREETGICSLEKIVNFSISTAYRSLQTCEAFVYKCEGDDEDYESGGVISSACTCDDPGQHEIQYVSQPTNDVITDDILLENLYQLVPDAVSERLENEKIISVTPDEALSAWVGTTLNNIDPSIKASVYDENLILAFGMLRALKRALREQAGVA